MTHSRNRQIALPLHQGAKDDPPSIVIGEANAGVARALAAPERWPFRTAILSGPPRSGKSLFARWFAQQGVGTAIDGADALEETALFHRWNRAQEDGRPLLLIADRTPWTITLPDLASRMGAALPLAIGAPDDAMVADLIASHAQRRGLALGDGALTYLTPRTMRDFAAIERLVAAIDRLSLERKAPPRMGIWRDALDAVQGPPQARLL